MTKHSVGSRAMPKLIAQWFREAILLEATGCHEIPKSKHGELRYRFERTPAYEADAARFTARWASPGKRRSP